MNAVCFLLGNSPTSEFYMLTFRNTLSVPSSYQPMKMEQTECSETSANEIQMPQNYLEESIRHSEHDKSLKSKIIWSTIMESPFTVSRSNVQFKQTHNANVRKMRFR